MAKTSLSDSVYQILLERIIKCEYAPGSLLSEEQLVHELNASRTPIRSALVRLQQEDLVQTLPKKGILVKDITANSIRDLFNLRELIELYAIENYGQNFPKDRLLSYLNAFAPIKEGYALDPVFQSDVAFHTEIVSMTGNELLCNYYESMQHKLSRFTNLCGLFIKSRAEISNNEHTDIILALLKDDISAAADALKVHLKQARDVSYQMLLELHRVKN